MTKPSSTVDIAIIPRDSISFPLWPLLFLHEITVAVRSVVWMRNAHGSGERLLALAAEIRGLSLSVYLRLPVRSGPLGCIRYYPRVRRYMRASGISPTVNRHRRSREEFATGSR